MDSLEEQEAVMLRQRLWGAAVLIALAVIFLPLLLDGAGSESQYRRVENLRQEPPRVIEESPRPTPAPRVVAEPIEVVEKPPVVVSPPKAPKQAPKAPAVTVAQAPKPVQVSSTKPKVAATPVSSNATAWVVQAGSFRDEQNAIAVRDRLRSAGHPAFITSSEDRELFRVRVGPMTEKLQAAVSKDDVMRLLGREALVTPYP